MTRYNLSLRFERVQVCEDRPASPPPLEDPERVVSYMAGAFDQFPEQETFWVIILNVKNVPRARQMITLGTLTSASVHPRETFRAAIVAGAASIICVHNHPSGDPAPSSADVHTTRELREAGKTLKIPVLDHVVIGNKDADPTGLGYYSFRQAGIL